MNRAHALFLLAALSSISHLPAAEYWLKAHSNNEADKKVFTTASYWIDAEGNAATALASGDIFHIENGYTARVGTSQTLFGPLHLGAEDATSSGKLNFRNLNLTVTDLLWHNGSIELGYSEVSQYLYGGRCILDCPSATHKIETTTADFIFPAKFVCSDADMTVTLSASKNNANLVLSGDNAGYLGSFSFSKANLSGVSLILAHENALGDPETARADALSTASANAILAVSSAVTPNAARGIKINNSGFTIRAAQYTKTGNGTQTYSKTTRSWTCDCTSYTLPMPISGSYGFTKDGAGEVTISGVYTAGAITVKEGTLSIAATADFPKGHPITVQSGATLIVHQSPKNFSITAEDGATVEQVVDPLVVEYSYDEETKTHTVATLTRPSSFEIEAGTVQPISLSSAIALPLHDGLTVEALRVAAGAADLSADDFEDATEKTYGLPKTTVSVTKDGDGVQHVWLTARPVVKSDGAFGSTSLTLKSNFYHWSDGLEVHSGADYLLVDSVVKIGNDVFDGDSLTIAKEADHLYSRDSTSRLSEATTIHPGVTIIQGTANKGVSSIPGAFVVYGNIHLAGGFNDDFFIFSAKYKGGWHRLSASLSGEGALKVTSGKTEASGLTGDVGNPQLYGDNSAWKGKMWIAGSSNGAADTTEEKGMPMTFNSPKALGGSPDEFRENAITLSNYSRLNPTGTMTLDTANRGIKGSGPFSFDVPEDATLTVKMPILFLNACSGLYKHGAGALELGGEARYESGKSGVAFYVREGAVAALNDAAVAGMSATFSDGTEIVLRDDAELATGFAGFAVAEGGTVTVRPAAGFAIPAGRKYKCAISTEITQNTTFTGGGGTQSPPRRQGDARRGDRRG